jgi:hypothetical protein
MSIYFELDFDREVYPNSDFNIKLYKEQDDILLKSLDKNNESLTWEYNMPIASIEEVGGSNTLNINFSENIDVGWGMIKIYDSSDTLLDSIPSTSNNITIE